MKSTTNKSKPKMKEMTALFSSTILITMFLFFIDEGYYNFKWMANIGNWIVFLVYATAIFLGQLCILKLFLKNYQKSGKMLMTIIGGSTIGFLFVIGFIFL